jgi:hypothetical protein
MNLPRRSTMSSVRSWLHRMTPIVLLPEAVGTAKSPSRALLPPLVLPASPPRIASLRRRGLVVGRRQCRSVADLARAVAPLSVGGDNGNRSTSQNVWRRIGNMSRQERQSAGLSGSTTPPVSYATVRPRRPGSRRRPRSPAGKQLVSPSVRNPGLPSALPRMRWRGRRTIALGDDRQQAPREEEARALGHDHKFAHRVNLCNNGLCQRVSSRKTARPIRH